MLQNSSEFFVHQCSKNKFLDTLDNVLTSQRTSPIVRECLLDVLADAAYVSSGALHKNESSFRVLWRKSSLLGNLKRSVFRLLCQFIRMLSRITGCTQLAYFRAESRNTFSPFFGLNRTMNLEP